MELRHLRYFVAVAEEEHVTRAAARLRIAQPPLSRQIHQLEAELGVALFVRHGRRLRLTEAGRQFLDGARATLRSAEHAIARARDADRGVVGRLAVGFVESSVHGGLPPDLLRRFRARHPGISLTLVPLTSLRQGEELRQGTIHAGFLYHLPDDPRIASLKLGNDRVVVAMSRRHRLARRARLHLRDLASEAVVWFPRRISPRFHDGVTQAWAKAGVMLDIVQEVDQTPAMLSLVAAGMGITFLVAGYRHLKPAEVVLRPVEDLKLAFDLSLCWRKDDESPALRTFLAMAREAATAVRGRGLQ